MGDKKERTVVLEPLEMSEVEKIALADEVITLASEIEIDVTADQALLCVKHLLYVQQVNQYMNLTRINDMHEALILHIVDSLSLARSLPMDPERFLDMGTGAGFPGIPFQILMDCEGVLLDSVGKKISAVNAFISALGLDGLVGVHDRLSRLLNASVADLIWCLPVQSVSYQPLLSTVLLFLRMAVTLCLQRRIQLLMN